MQTWENDVGQRVRTEHPGEWSTEPDKGHWIDETTDLDCLIVRNRMGALCGYVGVPTGHPWHGIDYNNIEPYPDVNGGLTFSDFCFKDQPENKGVCHVPASGRDPDVWWLGFGCAHAHDVVPSMDEVEWFDASYKNWAFVTRECERLAEEIKAAV
jgi:hypothetical protein